MKNLKEIIERVSEKTLNLDIIGKDGVIVNGNSTNKNDIVFYTSHKGYNELMKEVLKELKNEK
jgi:hypothetical protein